MQNRSFRWLRQSYRRSIAMLLVLAVFFTISNVAFAGVSLTASLQVTDAEGAPGDTVSVAVYMEPGDDYPLQYRLQVDYDTNVLELAPTAAVKPELQSVAFNADTGVNGMIQVDAGFFGESMSFIDKKEKLFTINFVIKANAAVGDSAITISGASIEDEDLNSQPITNVTAGKVSIAALPAEPVEIAIGSASGLPGQTVNVPVVLTKSTGHVGSYGMQLDYNPDALSVVAVTGMSDDYFSSAFDNAAGYVRTAWVDATGGDHSPEAGQTLFNVAFLIKDTAAAGEQQITINSQEGLQQLTMTDESAVELEKTVLPGKITVSEVPGITPPTAPANLTATAGDAKAALGWNEAAGATGYKVYLRTDSGSYAEPLATVSGTTYEATGLTNGAKYYFIVKAFNGGGDSPASSEASAIPVAVPGSTPSPVTSEPSIIAATPAPVSANNKVEILVNGKVEKAGTATQSTVNGQSVTTVVIDPQMLQHRLAAEGQGAVITIPVLTQSDVVVGELDGAMLKNMEQQQAVIEIKTDTATYTLPARQISIDTISAQLGANISLQDIKLRITIAKPQEGMAKIVNNAAAAGGFSIVAPALDFSISGVYQDKTVAITEFNAYVQRTIALPADADPQKITTAVVVEADGSTRHVPTKVVQTGGIYYAQINSLTNSTYSVVWHPVTFADVENHWARAAVNEMGSRMVVSGVSAGRFAPNQNISRAEFAAIVARALGLKLETSSSASFSDVQAGEWYSDAVYTASTSGLINGYKDGTFRPLDSITREEAMMILSKAMKVSGIQDKLAGIRTDASLRTYTDASQASAWAAESIEDCLHAGIVSGRAGNSLAPGAQITRAEAVTFIQRLLQNAGLI